MRWFTAAALVLSACGQAGDARVQIDVAELWQQAGQSVSVIHVRVYEGTTLQQEDTLTGVSDEAVLEVLAGTLRFEVEAVNAAAAPSYFGEHTQTISAGDATVDVLVPVFPAGGVEGIVAVSDGTAIPAGTVVVCTADAPRADADAPNRRELTIASDGTFAGALLDGATTLTVAYDAATPYAGSTTVTVVQEQVAGGLTVAVAP